MTRFDIKIAPFGLFVLFFILTVNHLNEKRNQKDYRSLIS